jgi:hypothetical protein
VSRFIFVLDWIRLGCGCAPTHWWYCPGLVLLAVLCFAMAPNGSGLFLLDGRVEYELRMYTNEFSRLEQVWSHGAYNQLASKAWEHLTETTNFLCGTTTRPVDQRLTTDHHREDKNPNPRSPPARRSSHGATEYPAFREKHP